MDAEAHAVANVDAVAEYAADADVPQRTSALFLCGVLVVMWSSAPDLRQAHPGFGAHKDFISSLCVLAGRWCNAGGVGPALS